MADGRGLHISNYFLNACFFSDITSFISRKFLLRLSYFDLNQSFLDENRDLVVTAVFSAAILLNSHRSSNFQKWNTTSQTSLTGILAKVSQE